MDRDLSTLGSLTHACNQEGCKHYPNIEMDDPEDVAAAENYLSFCTAKGAPWHKFNQAIKHNKPIHYTHTHTTHHITTEHNATPHNTPQTNTPQHIAKQYTTAQRDTRQHTIP